MNDPYQQQLGERLRSVRTMQGMTLAEVEARSDGVWKAVVVGSYERGDRAVSVARLSELAAFYGVPVGHLLPESSSNDRLTLDLGALDANADDLDTLVRFVDRIQQVRGDYNGRVLTLRLDDLRTVATATGGNVEDLLALLEERGVLPQ